MKEKIDLFAKGVFSYERPELTSSVGNIYISVEMGKVFAGSFVVSSSANRPFKGLVYSSDCLLTLDRDSFSGTENTINYKFDATHLDINDSIKGHISVVSEYGELDIPFMAKVKVPSCDTSIGPASDLYHFASLAQTDWAEAKNLFRSEDFRRTLSFYDPKFDNLYRTLLRSGNISLALEELLVAARKKKPVGVTANVSELSWDMAKGPFNGSIILKKDTWGYSQLTVMTEGDFLSAERQIIWTDDFSGNEFELKLAVDPDKLHGGTNLGRIEIVSVREHLVIPVIIKNSATDMKSRLLKRRMRYMEMKLLTNYLDYRMNKLAPAKFMTETDKCLADIKSFRPETIRDRLLKIWLKIKNGHMTQAITALSVIFEDEDWGDDLLAYSAAMYLRALTEHDTEAQDILRRLRDLHENYLDARIFLACIHLDKRNRLSNSTRFDALRRSVGGGQNSPLVLYEACMIVEDEPTVLRSFSGFDLLVIRYGIRNHILGRNAVIHIADLAMREKGTSPLILSTLIKACETFHVNEVLEALCTHLIRGKVHDETAFKWLSIGVIEQINVKNLYENCLLSAGTRPGKALPKGMQSYFENGISLPDEVKAMFYANVLMYRTQSDSIQPILMQQMKEFALKKLSEGELSDNLTILYNNVLGAADLDESLTALLPDIVFKHRVEVEWPDATAVLVAHKELEDERVFPVKDGIAFIDIFTEDPEVLVEDGHGSRLVPGTLHMTKLITNSELIRLCAARCTQDERVILNSLENARYRGDSEEIYRLIRICIDESRLEKKFEIECRRELIEYYYENLEGDLMESLLVKTDLANLSRRERARMIDLMIMRELYSLAVKNMEIYGYTGVDVRRIAKLTSSLIMSGDPHIGNRLFTELCYNVFLKRRHDDAVLSYLVKYYNGDNDSMHWLWSTAIEAGIQADDLEERLLAQILFTETDMSYSLEVLMHYYDHGTNRVLIRAYMSYYAYKYLVKEHVPDSEMLELMRRETVYEENDLCILAILKYLSIMGKYSDTDRNFIEHKMALLESRGVIMPFFKNFGDGIHIPEGMQDKQYIEYHTDPRKHVRIHYCLITGDEDDSYVDEDMKDLGYGIFVSEFVLFYGELLQYYITEEDSDSYIVTESSEVRLEPELIGNEDTGYRQLNLIITAREMNDSKTMQKLLENYIKNEQLAKQLFEPLF